MPVQVSYPGVYVEEIPSTTRTVTGASTSATAFIDFFPRGPIDRAVRVNSFSDFERMFGGLDKRSEASYGMMQYFLNGGQVGWVVRVGDGAAKPATFKVDVETPTMEQIVQAARRALSDAQTAATQAKAAATAASAATDAATIQGKTADTAGFTRQAAEASTAAARAARNAQAGLELAIKQAAAATGGPAASTKAAASNAALAAGDAQIAAQASADAAQASSDMGPQAKAAYDTGAAARAARTEVLVAQGVQAADSQVKAASDAKTAAAAEQAKITDKATPDVCVSAAEAAAAQAGAAAAAAQSAAEATANAAQLAGAFAVIDAAKDAVKQAVAAGTAAGAAQARAKQARTQLSAGTGDLAKTTATAAAADAVQAATSAATVAQAVRDQAVTLVGLAAGAKSEDIAGKSKDRATNASKAAGDAATAVTGANTVAQAATKAIGDASDAAQDAATAAAAAAKAGLAAAQGTPGADEAFLIASEADFSARNAADAVKTSREAADLIRGRVEGAISAAVDQQAAANSAKGVLDPLIGATPFDPAAGLPAALKAAQAAEDACAAAADVAKSVGGADLAVSDLAVQVTSAALAAARGAEAGATATGQGGAPPQLAVSAINPGAWGNNLSVTVANTGVTFRLEVKETVVRNNVARVINHETFNNLTLDAASVRYAEKAINASSALISVAYQGPQMDGAYPKDVQAARLTGGVDGGLPDATALTGTDVQARLDQIAPEIFNILCIPAAANFADSEAAVAYSNAHAYCQQKRAFLIVDIPKRVDTVDKMNAWLPSLRGATAYCSAVYFPRLVIADPLDEYRARNVGPSGTLAGIYARTDSKRGVWKAPAGIGAVLEGAQVAVKLTDVANGQLNPLGINVLRSFPVYGNISWGARTMAGADVLTSEWKYINVRRLASYIEESLFQSLKWAVFEPNDEPLWSQIRLQVGSFMAGLFADGAFQGSTPDKAYFVRCDSTTTTQTDIQLGIVNIMVGFAPVKPAEFVVLQVQQIAGQAA